MSFSGVERSLTQISEELNIVEDRRERLLKDSREVVNLSAKAIVYIHIGRLKEAEKNLQSAERLLLDLRKVAKEDLQRYLVQPEAEYVEASIFRAIVCKERSPTHRQLKVRSVSYILGLLDVIGEIKRLVYERIRTGDGEEAYILFNKMEKLYLLLSPFAIHDHIAQGVRRKLDVTRILIEDTRSAVTEETRRSELVRSMEKLSKKLRSSKSRTL